VYECLKRKVEFRTSTEVIKLITDEDTMTGVIARDSSGTRKIRARKGVLLATGGYDWRKDFVRSYDALPEAGSMALPTVTGDHFVLASNLGAIPVPARAPAQTPIFVGYRVPSELIYGKPSTRMWIPGNPHCIVVNKSGERFGNDSFYPDIATRVGRFDGQGDGYVNWPAWIVFDQDMLDKYGLLPYYPGQPLPDDMGAKAGTVRELANAVGIDADKLETTVKRFNGFCETGIDEDFGRGTMPWGRIMTGDPRQQKNQNLGEIHRGPFYAIKLERVTMGVPTSGLPIDADGRVKNAAGDAIPGLYAAGNSAAWQDWGSGYNSGIAGMRGMLYGYRAALHMTTRS
jgi:3-oxosteroid 1-dehydrogenase